MYFKYLILKTKDLVQNMRWKTLKYLNPKQNFDYINYFDFRTKKQLHKWCQCLEKYSPHNNDNYRVIADGYSRTIFNYSRC